MTIYIAHAPADREAAEALERALERQGQFTELDDGRTALAPVQPADVVVLIVSNVLAFAETRPRLELRALDAWADGRLILVKLDKSPAPLGMRDLPALDASDEQERDGAWRDLGDLVRSKLEQGAPGAIAAKRPQHLGQGALPMLLMFVLMLPGIGALAAIAAIWLVNRIGPRPGGWPELIAGIEGFGARYGLAPAATPWLFALAVAVMLLALALLLARMRRRSSAEPAAGPPRKRGSAAHGDASGVCVAYAPLDRERVTPLIETIKAAGRTLIVADGTGGQECVRSAARVVVICSAAAFESDHVRRLLYLADRYGKKPVTVYIEDAVPPENFSYFLAGAPAVKLHETPEADRPQAFLAVLG